MFNRFMGMKKPAAETVETTPDLSKLNQHVSTLDKKEEVIQKKIDDLNNELAGLKQQMAKKGPNYNYLRGKASQVLQRRKMYENQLRSVNNMSMSMNQNLMTIENMQMMSDQVKVMKEVTNAQSQMFKNINLDEMYNLNDRMADMREDMDEFNEMMNETTANDVSMDENELDAELAALNMEDISMPSQPAFLPSQAQSQQTPQQAKFDANFLDQQLSSL